MNVRAKKVAMATLPAAGLGMGLVFFLFDPARAPIYPVCVFRRFTGLDCPGCGSQRAVHALLHGDLIAALHFNLLLVLSLPVVAWIGLRFIVRFWKNEPAPSVRMVWVWVYVGVWIAFGIVRNLPGPLFAAFRP